MNRIIKIDHYDAYEDDNIHVVIRANGHVIIQKKYAAFSSGPVEMVQLEFDEFQRIVNIVTMHHQIKQIKKV